MINSNVELMEFFASISSGTCNSSEKFEVRKVSYSSLIGKFDALGILSRVRPVPKPGLLDKINEELIKKNIPVPKEWDIPSAVAMEKISDSLAKMREGDSNKCVNATEIRLYKNQISIYLHQALTYETFLER
ncbi:hypothetical protein CH352_16215 [Leptospira hartskeerlii]|uniref:Uncharacterized protein n=1 Tax=Leptospira hartskeerlii TaxID=2023177 RepID=A0A2M9X9H4_9LEPT|nr:hypothetical protein [Leptospira hartskeerlii]PJZ24304.1 hypothetical protein CH357_16710 [Leptospira hartskeerlii]PJZ32489.1 hypothetical protein CH352_16215 [Leptospira hartskeerlii]